MVCLAITKVKKDSIKKTTSSKAILVDGTIISIIVPQADFLGVKDTSPLL